MSPSVTLSSVGAFLLGLRDLHSRENEEHGDANDQETIDY